MYIYIYMCVCVCACVHVCVCEQFADIVIFKCSYFNLVCLIVFYGISILRGYLMPNSWSHKHTHTDTHIYIYKLAT